MQILQPVRPAARDDATVIVIVERPGYFHIGRHSAERIAQAIAVATEFPHVLARELTAHGWTLEIL